MAGRGFANNDFLDVLFRSFTTKKINYLVIAVRAKTRTVKEEKNKKGEHKISCTSDYSAIIKYIDALYSCQYFEVPLRGLLIIGY